MNEARVSASDGVRSLGRNEITASQEEFGVVFYRTDGQPALFAGFRQEWIDGEDPKTGVVFEMQAGAGLGSKYLTLTVTVPGHAPIYEYVDMAEVLTARVAAICAETVPTDRPAAAPRVAAQGEAGDVGTSPAAGVPPCSGGAPAQDPDSPPYASPMAYRAVPVHERGWVG